MMRFQCEKESRQGVRDGAVSAKWSYRADRREIPPEQNPRFIFTAHSAWCNFAKSGNALEVGLRRLEIARAEWTYHYSGEKLDAKPRYVFEVSGSRCKKTESGECQVRNPRVVSMEWDKKDIYYGDKTTLKISSFELSDENSVCKLQLWEKDYTTEDDFILEQDITIDSDEVETEFEFNFDIEKVLDEEDDDLEIFCRLIFEGRDLASKIYSFIFIRTTGARR